MISARELPGSQQDSAQALQARPASNTLIDSAQKTNKQTNKQASNSCVGLSQTASLNTGEIDIPS